MLPVLGALILQAAYGAVDLLVVGRFGSTAGLSAVSTGSQMLEPCDLRGHAARDGRYRADRAVSSAKNGRSRSARCSAARRSCSPFYPSGDLCPARGLCPADLCSDAGARGGRSVSRQAMCASAAAGIFFIVAYNLLSAIFRGLGDSRSPLLFVLVACLVNIAGDLVAGGRALTMDAAGAAIATVAGAGGQRGVRGRHCCVRKKLPFAITRADFRFNPQCRKFLSIGLPLALQEFLTQLSFLGALRVRQPAGPDSVVRLRRCEQDRQLCHADSRAR